MPRKRKRKLRIPLSWRFKAALVLIIIIAKLLGYNIRITQPIRLSRQSFIQKQAISLAWDGIKHRIANRR